MSRKRRKAECLTGGEKLLFCVVAVFFCATLLRSVNFAPLAQARETVQTWLTGELDLGKAVEAIGQFTQEEHLQSVFRDIFPNTHAQDTQQTDEPPNTEPAESTNPPDESAAFADAVESADLTDTLAARAASAFPDTVDSVVYPLDFLAVRQPRARSVHGSVRALIRSAGNPNSIMASILPHRKERRFWR